MGTYAPTFGFIGEDIPIYVGPAIVLPVSGEAGEEAIVTRAEDPLDIVGVVGSRPAGSDGAVQAAVGEELELVVEVAGIDGVFLGVDVLTELDEVVVLHLDEHVEVVGIPDRLEGALEVRFGDGFAVVDLGDRVARDIGPLGVDLAVQSRGGAGHGGHHRAIGQEHGFLVGGGDAHIGDTHTLEHREDRHGIDALGAGSGKLEVFHLGGGVGDAGNVGSGGEDVVGDLGRRGVQIRLHHVEVGAGLLLNSIALSILEGDVNFTRTTGLVGITRIGREPALVFGLDDFRRRRVIAEHRALADVGGKVSELAIHITQTRDGIVGADFNLGFRRVGVGIVGFAIGDPNLIVADVGGIGDFHGEGGVVDARGLRIEELAHHTATAGAPAVALIDEAVVLGHETGAGGFDHRGRPPLVGFDHVPLAIPTAVGIPVFGVDGDGVLGVSLADEDRLAVGGGDGVAGEVLDGQRNTVDRRGRQRGEGADPAVAEKRALWGVFLHGPGICRAGSAGRHVQRKRKEPLRWRRGEQTRGEVGGEQGFG